MHPRAVELIELLRLLPHPEGGWYAQTYRSSMKVMRGDDARVALTTIYFLLVAGTHSKWHRVRSDEVWHWYDGDPLELLMFSDSLSVHRLGPVSDSMRPVCVVPANAWQAARPLGEYTLAGCTVGPGFVFDDFVMLRDVEDEETRRALRDYADVI